MKKYISFAFAIFIFTTPLLAEKAKSESIKLLMQQTGAKDMASQMMQQMLPSLKRFAPDAPEAFWEKAMHKMDMDKMVALIIPIYQKYLTEEDIQAVIQFYNTPTGKKFIKVSPNIMQESMIAGQQWGQSIAKDIIEDLKKEGYMK